LLIVVVGFMPQLPVFASVPLTLLTSSSSPQVPPMLDAGVCPQGVLDAFCTGIYE